MKPLLRGMMAAAFLLQFASTEAFYIHLHGVVTEHFSGDPLRDVQVRIVKDGIERETVLTGRDGKYEFDLDRGYEYLIWFYREGWVTKHVKIDTRKVPPIPDVPFYDMDLQMTMFAWIEGVDLTIFEQPLGLAEYKPSVHNISWDVEYTERIRPQLADVMDEYEKAVRNPNAKRRTLRPTQWPPKE